MKKIIIFIISFLLLIILIVIYARFIGTNGLITKEYKIDDNNIASSFAGLKIVQFSDVHYNKNLNKQLLKDTVKEINLIKPDIVIFTGDLLDDNTIEDTTINFIVEQLTNINVKYHKYAILGEHDYEYGYEKVSNILENSGFILLKNKYDIIINDNNDKILIGGLDSYTSNKADINQLINEETKSINYKIIAIHEPDYTDIILKELDANIILAGHSHNGQIAIPLLNTLFLPKYATKYYDNFYQINNTKLYVSSGIGNSNFDFRLFNHPSINFYRFF
ncbi:MAG: metallophosphoesterase [bacterium]|nr:metallophosphoesterase [bacterium]